MKQKSFILALCAVATIGCMNQEKQTVIGKQHPKIENRLFSAEALWAMGRMGSVAVNAATGDVAYQVSYYSVEENRSNTELFLLQAEADGYAEPKQLTQTPYGENSPAWMPDGRLAYLSTESGASQDRKSVV